MILATISASPTYPKILIIKTQKNKKKRDSIPYFNKLGIMIKFKLKLIAKKVVFLVLWKTSLKTKPTPQTYLEVLTKVKKIAP